MIRYAHQRAKTYLRQVETSDFVDLNERHTRLGRVNEARIVATRCKSGTQGGKNGRSRSKEVKNKEKGEEEFVVV